MRTFRLKSVADRLGVSPHTIRAWEKRYGAVKPDRSGSGRRVYSQEEVARLVLLGELVRQGHSISQIAQLSEKKLMALSSRSEAVSVPEKQLEPMLAALHHFNIETLRYHLSWAALSLGCREFIFSVVVPLMKTVGSLVQNGKMAISQEHALSSLLRTHFSKALEVLQSHQAHGKFQRSDHLLLTTPEGDQHEFGILLSAALCADLGVPAYYLGPSIPAVDIVDTAHRLEMGLVVLGNLPTQDPQRQKELSQFFKVLDEQLDPEIEVWVGGVKPTLGESWGSGRPLSFLPSLATFEQKLLAWRDRNKD